MKLVVILRTLPLPLHAGLNLIIHNVLSRLSKKHSLYALILDQNKHDNIYFNYFKDCIFFEKNEFLENALELNCHIPFVEKYYFTKNKKILWIESKIRQIKPKAILGFGYNLLGYFGLLRSNSLKILNVVDSEPLFLWREILTTGFNFANIKKLFFSLMIARKNIKKCDYIITVSKEDSSNLKQITGFDKIITIPNGVDIIKFHPNDHINKSADQVIFVGSLSWPPNRQAITWFIEECWEKIIKRIPTATLIVIGKNPEGEFVEKLQTFPNVRVLGFVEDIIPFVCSSMVSIAPMISGSGIKNKILEAWALGTPVVSTHLGAKGLKCTHGNDILLADSPEDFAKAVLSLLASADRRNRIGTAGVQNAAENYSWDSVANEFDKLFPVF